MSQDWQRLGAYVVQRRNELGYGSQTALEEASGVSYRTISRLETGVRIGKNNLRKLETTLRWQLGSMDRVLAGGEPAESEPTSRLDRPGIEDVTPEELVEMRQVVEDVMGPDAADEFLRKAIARRSTGRGRTAG